DGFLHKINDVKQTIRKRVGWQSIPASRNPLTENGKEEICVFLGVDFLMKRGKGKRCDFVKQ
ncbi:MAG: hypothetical protein LBT94_06610, partial [Prevotellaceae bacterium]|nr:hypothetical protein [Prevotellaceae bacterium]